MRNSHCHYYFSAVREALPCRAPFPFESLAKTYLLYLVFLFLVRDRGIEKEKEKEISIFFSKRIRRALSYTHSTICIAIRKISLLIPYNMKTEHKKIKTGSSNERELGAPVSMGISN